MIRLTNQTTKEFRSFRTARAAGRFLEKRGYPEGLVYAPYEDRVGLVAVLAGSEWGVTGWSYGVE